VQKSLVVTMGDGSFHVARDFPGDYTQQVDRILAGVFKGNPAVTGITFRWSGKSQHDTATLDDPHWSASGRDYARIDASVARGEITSEQAIAAYQQIAQRVAASDGALTRNHTALCPGAERVSPTPWRVVT
jgi:hypothetical protein